MKSNYENKKDTIKILKKERVYLLRCLYWGYSVEINEESKRT